MLQQGIEIESYDCYCLIDKLFNNADFKKTFT
jgi:hypothetical protein